MKFKEKRRIIVEVSMKEKNTFINVHPVTRPWPEASSGVFRLYLNGWWMSNLFVVRTFNFWHFKMQGPSFLVKTQVRRYDYLKILLFSKIISTSLNYLPKVILPLIIVGSFCVSAIAASGIPQLATGPQKCVLST